MSRLDDIEARLATLEAAAGTELKDRIQQLEDLLGLPRSHQGFAETAAPIEAVHCDRCGMNQPKDFKCAQTKCPLKA